MNTFFCFRGFSNFHLSSILKQYLLIFNLSHHYFYLEWDKQTPASLIWKSMQRPCLKISPQLICYWCLKFHLLFQSQGPLSKWHIVRICVNQTLNFQLVSYNSSKIGEKEIFEDCISRIGGTRQKGKENTRRFGLGPVLRSRWQPEIQVNRRLDPL